MSTIAVQFALDANLAALGRSNADVVHLLRTSSSALDVSFTETPQDLPAGFIDGRQMCSRHKPLDEAQRLIESVDLVEHAVIVVLGFGMGYHIRALAERMGKAGVIIVFEPDLAVARAVMQRVDHSDWINKTNLIWMTEPRDRAMLASKLQGVESVLAQGVVFVAHPASRDRLGERSGEFSRMFSEFMESAKTVLLTQLVRAVDAVRNMALNVDHYVSCQGIADLKDAALGCTAVVVSAGPSLRRNMQQLAQPGVRERVVIIAVQTVLKPLLAAGIKPHFVTALDYHEISRRFYEGLTAEDVRGITLIAEPKVHPAVLDAFPGVVRCVAASFLDDLLGPAHERSMGELPTGTTVAHLAAYLAQHLGCSSIAMIGQDLGFTDGQYYSPGTAIDDVWSPELNAFNTIEMMQWQRIVRHRQHLHKLQDVHDRPIYTDGQMFAYLQQFERDFQAFAGKGMEVIDATEGGVRKAHTSIMSLSEVLQSRAERAHGLEQIQTAIDEHNEAARRAAAARRIAIIRREIAELRETSRRTQRLIETMLADQADSAKMKQHFQKLKKFQERVGKRAEAFKVLEYLNQMGSFNRRKADRRLHMQRELTPMQRQKLELQRDAENVSWLMQAADELIEQLSEAERSLAPSSTAVVEGETSNRSDRSQPKRGVTSRVAVIIPIDPHRDGLGRPRSLADVIDGRSVLQATLQRLCASATLQRVILIVPRSFDVETLIDREALALPVEVERCEGDSPFGPEHRAITIARLFADTSWRGGIGGMSVYDEVLCPQIMHDIMTRRELDAALIAGPDWPMIDGTSDEGCDGVVRRFDELNGKHGLVFTQAPPGLCGCVVSAALMKQLCHRNRLATIAGVLGYQPQLPRPDAIGTDANVPIDHRIRNADVRATYSTSSNWRRADESQSLSHFAQPVKHLIVELCGQRSSTGLFHERLRDAAGQANRSPMDLQTAKRIFDEHAAAGDCVVTLAGLGDPLLHPQFDQIIARAKASGMLAVHVRTELLAGRDVLQRLLDASVDVVSVDLHADCAATYQAMMGCDRFGEVLENIQFLLEHRCRLTDHAPAAAFALPWLVMRMQRCAETYNDIESFFDRWQHVLGTAVIEGWPGGIAKGDSIDAAVTPPQVETRARRRRVVVLSDGTRCGENMARLFLP